MNHDDDDDDETIGPAGVPFPREHEWLDLPLPSASELPRQPDFVERTLRAITADGRPEPLLTADRLAAYAAPEPSSSFVDATLAALRQDRKERWRELLARHIAPEPAPGFVARTLAALAADRAPGRGSTGAAAPRHARRPGHRLRRLGPLLAIAAAALVWILLRPDDRAPLEQRFAQSEPAAFAAAWTASPLAAVLDEDARAQDPFALPDGGPDGTWLLLEAPR
mgnify:CR=1 FL=1